MLYFKLPFDFGFNVTEFVENQTVKELLSRLDKNYEMPLIDTGTAPNLCKNITDFFNSNITRFRIFYYPPNMVSNIHIDGSSDRPTQWAINFPIFGTNDSLMEWAKIKQNATGKAENRYNAYSSKSSYFTEDEVEYFYDDKLVLDSPHIVNTVIPHRAVNNKNSSRAILSVRLGLSASTPIEEIYKFVMT